MYIKHKIDLTPNKTACESLTAHLKNRKKTLDC